MAANDLVSVIMPLYESAQYVQGAIESVIAQTYTKWELLVTDDCSHDDSCEVVSKFVQNDPRIRLIRLEKNSGVAAARNTSTSAAKGRFIAFLDSDDLWSPQKLDKQVAFMLERDAFLSYTAYSKIDDGGEATKRQRTIAVPQTVTYDRLLMSNVIGCSTVMYDADRISKQFMRSIGHEDYILWLSILKAHGIAHGLNEPLTTYRERNDSLSGNKLKAARYQWNIYRTIEKLSIWKSIRNFANYAYYGYKKYNV